MCHFQMHPVYYQHILHSGGAWLARNHLGQVLFHAREAFTSSPNRIIAEFHCLIWALQSFLNLCVPKLRFTSDCQTVIEALSKPSEWPRYRLLITQVNNMRAVFRFCSLELEALRTNTIVRDIPKSVLRDGCFQSYLAMGEPSWLHERLQREVTVRLASCHP